MLQVKIAVLVLHLPPELQAPGAGVDTIYVTYHVRHVQSGAVALAEKLCDRSCTRLKNVQVADQAEQRFCPPDTPSEPGSLDGYFKR